MTEPSAIAPPARAPSGLGKAGRSLWRSFGAYVFDARETAALAAACRQADDIAALEAELATGTLIVEGSKGQPVLNSAVAELRQGRLALSRLLGSLDLPAEDAGSLTPRQLQARKASNTRWDLQRRRLGKTVAGRGPSA